MLLKIELYRYKNVIMGCVLEQDKSITTETIDDNAVLSRCDNVCVCSSDKPEVKIDKSSGRMNVNLHIRGCNSDEDDKTFAYEFKNESIAKGVAWKISKCVDKINNLKNDNSFEKIL